MSIFNRIIASLLWLILLVALSILAVIPIRTVETAAAFFSRMGETLRAQQAANPANYLIGQVAAGVIVLLIFGLLIALEVWTGPRRGVRIRTVQGGSAELDTLSIGRRLSWHLDQLAEIISVVPIVKSKGGAVDIKLEIEAAPDVDVPMKTDEVVEVTRDIIEQDMGLKLGKLDVHMRYAPFDPEWVQ